MPYKECKMIINYSIGTVQKTDIGFVNGMAFDLQTCQMWDGYDWSKERGEYTYNQDSRYTRKYLELREGRYYIVEYSHIKSNIVAHFDLEEVGKLQIVMPTFKKQNWDLSITDFIPELKPVPKTVYFPMNDPENIAMNDQAMARITQRA